MKNNHAPHKKKFHLIPFEKIFLLTSWNDRMDHLRLPARKFPPIIPGPLKFLYASHFSHSLLFRFTLQTHKKNSKRRVT